MRLVTLPSQYIRYTVDGGQIAHIVRQKRSHLVECTHIHLWTMNRDALDHRHSELNTPARRRNPQLGRIANVIVPFVYISPLVRISLVYISLLRAEKSSCAKFIALHDRNIRLYRS